jgi:hypothetical protein
MRGRAAKTEKQQQLLVDVFNRTFPVGTKVYLRKDSGEVPTEVNAPAQLMPGPIAVAWFDGVAGCYAIEGRVRALAG